MISNMLLFLLLSFLQTSSGFKNQNFKSYDDLPKKSDLDEYLRSLKSVSEYNKNSKFKVDHNLALGVFLADVQLYHILSENCKIPKDVLDSVREILHNNDELLKYYRQKYKNYAEFRGKKDNKITTLFSNVSMWMSGLDNMKTKRLRSLHISENPELAMYKEVATNELKWKPNRQQSDLCLLHLANNVANTNRMKKLRCRVSNTCLLFLTNGSNFSYPMGHRILMLLVARIGRGCFIFSPRKDRELLKKFCSMVYYEVEYIAMNNFWNVDVMLELMCLCALDGYGQFLRRPWLNGALAFQSVRGCFGQNVQLYAQQFDVQELNTSVEYYMECRPHTTAVATATLANAIRYIIESNY